MKWDTTTHFLPFFPPLKSSICMHHLGTLHPVESDLHGVLAHNDLTEWKSSLSVSHPRTAHAKNDLQKVLVKTGPLREWWHKKKITLPHLYCKLNNF